MKDSREYAVIVEYSYDPKNEQFVVRFLDNSSYVIKVTELPQKMQARKPDWENTVLSEKRDALMVPSGAGYREIQFHVIHARGTLL